VRLINIVVVVLPLLGVVAAGVLLWGRGFRWVELSLLGGMYALTALGITVGFHRLFTHRSFETGRAVQVVLVVLGSMAVQGPLLHWVALHRRHHQHSDQPDDPHSPHHSGPGLLGLLRGWWHAHLGWVFKPDPPDLPRYVKDLAQSRCLRLLSSLFPLWALVGLLLPTLLGALLTGGWAGALLGLLWGGLARLCLVHHVTWSVNSLCHLWGAQPYPCHDQSRNNGLFGLLALGEGWHNNHHAFPTPLVADRPQLQRHPGPLPGRPGLEREAPRPRRRVKARLQRLARGGSLVWRMARAMGPARASAPALLMWQQLS
jgi:stearoyl-CoA desaturase (delta-9 desaturase)